MDEPRPPARAADAHHTSWAHAHGVRVRTNRIGMAVSRSQTAGVEELFHSRKAAQQAWVVDWSCNL